MSKICLLLLCVFYAEINQVLNVTVLYAIYMMSSNTLHCFSLSFSPIALNCFETVL